MAIRFQDVPNKVTPRKTNMSPENQWLEDVFPIKIVPFRRHVHVPRQHRSHTEFIAETNMFIWDL